MGMWKMRGDQQLNDDGPKKNEIYIYIYIYKHTYINTKFNKSISFIIIFII